MIYLPSSIQSSLKQLFHLPAVLYKVFKNHTMVKVEVMCYNIALVEMKVTHTNIT